MSNLHGETVEVWRNRIEALQKAISETESSDAKQTFRIRIETIQKWIDQKQQEIVN